MKLLAQQAVLLALAKRVLDFMANDDERETRAMEVARSILALRLDDRELSHFDVCNGVLAHRMERFALRLIGSRETCARELASLLALGMLLEGVATN